MSDTTLYRFYDNAGRLLYVGISGIATVRWLDHARTKDWWRSVASVRVEHFDQRTDAADAEWRAIHAEHPVHNVIGNGPVRLPRLGYMRTYGTGTVFRRRGRTNWTAQRPASAGRAARSFASREEAERWLEAD